LPTELTRAGLLEMLDGEGFAAQYNFVYQPVNFSTLKSLDFAFVNMISHEAAKKSMAKSEDFSRSPGDSSKSLELNWCGRMQGLDSCIERYRNSTVMHEDVPDEYRPLLLVDGKPAPFPAATTALQPPPKLRRSSTVSDRSKKVGTAPIPQQQPADEPQPEQPVEQVTLANVQTVPASTDKDPPEEKDMVVEQDLAIQVSNEQPVEPADPANVQPSSRSTGEELREAIDEEHTVARFRELRRLEMRRIHEEQESYRLSKQRKFTSTDIQNLEDEMPLAVLHSIGANLRPKAGDGKHPGAKSVASHSEPLGMDSAHALHSASEKIRANKSAKPIENPVLTIGQSISAECNRAGRAPALRSRQTECPADDAKSGTFKQRVRESLRFSSPKTALKKIRAMRVQPQAFCGASGWSVERIAGYADKLETYLLSKVLGASAAKGGS